MPLELFEIVKSQIIENKIIRRNAKWIHIFEENKENKDKKFIELKQTIKYELHNLSRDCVPNPLTLQFQEDIDSTQKLLKAKCKTPNGRVIASYDNNNSNNNLGVSEENNDDKNITEKRFNMEIPPQTYIEVEMEFLYEYYQGVQGDYFTKYPVIDAELYVYFPKNYDFNVFPVLSSPLEKKIDNNGYYLYELKGGILPYQGFVFKLKPKPKD